LRRVETRTNEGCGSECCCCKTSVSIKCNGVEELVVGRLGGGNTVSETEGTISLKVCLLQTRERQGMLEDLLCWTETHKSREYI